MTRSSYTTSLDLTRRYWRFRLRSATRSEMASPSLSVRPIMRARRTLRAGVCSRPGRPACAAVGVPDDVLGERVGVLVVPLDGQRLVLDGLVRRRAAQGYGLESFSEHLVVVDELHVASGGKVAKHLLHSELVHAPMQPSGQKEQKEVGR